MLPSNDCFVPFVLLKIIIFCIHRLQMDEELRREREREREREKEREADREREKEREREREREKKEMEREKERERERELERQRERTREKEATLLKNLENQYLAETEVHPHRMHQEERVKPTEPPAPTRTGNHYLAFLV